MEPIGQGLDLGIVTLALPLTLGAVQVLKEAGLPTRWAGVAALLVGMLVGLALGAEDIGNTRDITRLVLSGAVAGLSAAGVWSGAKALRET